MLTNILLITLLIVLISGVAYLRKLIKDVKTAVINTVIARSKYTLEGTRKKCEELDTVIKKNFGELSNKLINNKDLLITIRKDYLKRIETQERLIAELKVNQAPEEVVETVSLINEWLTGKEE